MLKGFWLNFVLTVAVCMGGLCSVNVIAEIPEEDTAWFVSCSPTAGTACSWQTVICAASSGSCLAGPGRANETCICHANYAAAGVGNGVCGCGDWFP